MRLTPDSRAPARVEPVARAVSSQLALVVIAGVIVAVGVVVAAVVAVVVAVVEVEVEVGVVVVVVVVAVTDALGVVLTSPCVRRGPGLRASRQHPSSEGG